MLLAIHVTALPPYMRFAIRLDAVFVIDLFPRSVFLSALACVKGALCLLVLCDESGF